MRRMTIGFYLATALAGYAVGQWQLAESRSVAQDAVAPPPAAAAPAAEQPAESDLERKYVEKSRQLFRTLTPEQQQQALGLLDQQLRQAEALAELKRVQQELRSITEKFPGTVGANLAAEAERVLQNQHPGAQPAYVPNANTPAYYPSPVLVPSGLYDDPAPSLVPRRPQPVPQPDGFAPEYQPTKPVPKSTKVG